MKSIRQIIEDVLKELGRAGAHVIEPVITAKASLIRNLTMKYGVKMKSVYRFECYDKNGNLKWVEEVPNIVVTAGLNDILNNEFKGAAYTAAWFVGLVDGGSAPTYNAADTMASHAGWTENAGYSNANRPGWTGGAVSGGSVDNSASQASFTINATSTIAGAFLVTNSTKSGTTGTLYGEASFTGGNRSVVSGDVLNVTVTLTAS